MERRKGGRERREREGGRSREEGKSEEGGREGMESERVYRRFMSLQRRLQVRHCT